MGNGFGTRIGRLSHLNSSLGSFTLERCGMTRIIRGCAVRSVHEMVCEPNSFLVLYLVSSPSLPFLCASRPVRPVWFLPKRTLGGFHITLAEGKRAILTPLSGYFECGTRRGFHWPTGDDQEILRWRKEPCEDGRPSYFFEFAAYARSRGVGLQIHVHAMLPIRKEIAFLELRHGVVYVRTDFGSQYRMATVKAQWPERFSRFIGPAWRLGSFAYCSSEIRCQSLAPELRRSLMEPEIAASDFPNIRTWGVPGKRFTDRDTHVVLKELP